jgi:hypothetical protein
VHVCCVSRRKGSAREEGGSVRESIHERGGRVCLQECVRERGRECLRESGSGRERAAVRACGVSRREGELMRESVESGRTESRRGMGMGDVLDNAVTRLRAHVHELGPRLKSFYQLAV